MTLPLKSGRSSRSRKAAWLGLAAWLFASSSMAGDSQQMTVWLTFDDAEVGPVVSCDGELVVSGGGRCTLRPWMFEPGDAIDGSSYQLTTGHSPETAAAAGLQRIRGTTLPKGLIVEMDSSRQAELRGTTKLGDFQVPLERLRRDKTLEVLEGKVRLQWIAGVQQLTRSSAQDEGSGGVAGAADLRCTETHAEEEFPSIALAPDGSTAVAFVAWDGESDRIRLGAGADRAEVTEAPGDYHEPRLAVDASGALCTVWAANDGRQWDLWARSGGRAIKLTHNSINDFRPRVIEGGEGNVWLVWQTVADDLHYEVMLAQLGPAGLSSPVNVSDHPGDDWEPAVCCTPDGRLVVAWDTYRNGSYDVYLREFARSQSGGLKPLGPPLPVAATAWREAHVTLAADSRSRVWLAWDVSMEDWGKHPKVGGTLHANRETEVACYADGKLHRPAADFQDSLPEPFGKFVEYPHVAVDGHDRVWVVWRMANEVRVTWHDPKLSRGGQNYAIWHWFASQYDGRQWTRPILIPRSNGRQDMRLDTATDPSGNLLIAFAADGRTRQYPYMPVDHDVFVASLAGLGVPVGDVQLADAAGLGRVTPADPDPELQPLPRKWTVGGKTYCLAIGDTHRHTDISRCMNGYDGSLQDAYRYALNACGLDWLAISDHDQDLLKHRHDRVQRPRQDYDWWRSQKYCDLYTIPGRFLALYAYEHGGSYKARGGHKNVVLAERGHPVVEVDAPKDLFAALAGSGAVAIPHQLADGGSRTDWEKWNPRYEAVAEIFQTRGSYEYADCPRVARIFTPGHSIWDALAGDVRIGIIASSDHGQTHQARACVYVDDVEDAAGDLAAAPGFTRQGVVDALLARRTFGATTAVAMQVEIQGNPVGTEITVDTAPTIEAKIVAPANVTAMAVVRDNRFVYVAEPNTAEADLQFHDLDLEPGQSSYYYVRALIGDDDVAWSSPIWVTRRK